MLSYNPIARSYDRIQHVMIMDFNLIQFYLNMCCVQVSLHPSLARASLRAPTWLVENDRFTGLTPTAIGQTIEDHSDRVH